jgi:hypothetical protein
MFEPVELWDVVARRLERPDALLHLILLAVLGSGGIALASEIGVRIFNTDWHRIAGYSTQPNRSWTSFFTLWAVYALAPVFQGLTGAWLLRFYRRPRQWRGALAVSVVGTIPLYIAGLSLVLLPGILLVCVAFLVSCMWWSSGSQQLLGVPPGESADYVAAMLVASSALLFLLSASLPF